MTGSSSDTHDLNPQVSSGARGEAMGRLIDLVKQQAAAALQVPPAELDDAGRSFADAGLDSLSAVELHRLLGEATGLSLPVSLAYDYPTPARLAEYLAAQ